MQNHFNREFKLIIVVFTIFLMGIFTVNPIEAKRESGFPNASLVHSIIDIDGLSEFEAFADKTGMGTQTAPYVIQNFEIDAGGTSAGISIQNVDKYIIIRNCTVINPQTEPSAGILIKHGKNIQIINCTVVSTLGVISHGIYLENMTNSVINNCFTKIPYSFSSGIKMVNVNNSIVSFNNISYPTYNGIFCDNCYHNSIIGNKISSVQYVAMKIWHSKYNIFSENWIYNNSFGLEFYDSHNSTVENNLFNDNTLGLTLGFAESNLIRSNQFNSNSKGIFAAESADNTTVLNNHFENSSNNAIYITALGGRFSVIGNTICASNAGGVYLFEVNNTIIQGNHISDCIDTGIVIRKSYSSEVLWNTISGGKVGISLSEDPYPIDISFNWIWLNRYNINQSGVETTKYNDYNWFVNPLYRDLDADGLSDQEEMDLGTDVSNKDTDNDDLDDALEITLGTDPLLSDTDQDGFIDGMEYSLGTDPLNAQNYPGSAEIEPSWYEELKTLLISLVIGAFCVVVLFGLNIFLSLKSRKVPQNNGKINTQTPREQDSITMNKNTIQQENLKTESKPSTPTKLKKKTVSP